MVETIEELQSSYAELLSAALRDMMALDAADLKRNVENLKNALQRIETAIAVPDGSKRAG